MTWKRSGRKIFELNSDNSWRFCCEVLPGYEELFMGDHISDDEAEKIATLMASAPALKAMVERLIEPFEKIGILAQDIVDARALLKELNHGE